MTAQVRGNLLSHLAFKKTPRNNGNQPNNNKIARTVAINTTNPTPLFHKTSDPTCYKPSFLVISAAYSKGNVGRVHAYNVGNPAISHRRLTMDTILKDVAIYTGTSILAFLFGLVIVAALVG